MVNVVASSKRFVKLDRRVVAVIGLNEDEIHADLACERSAAFKNFPSVGLGPFTENTDTIATSVL